MVDLADAPADQLLAAGAERGGEQVLGVGAREQHQPVVAAHGPTVPPAGEARMSHR